MTARFRSVLRGRSSALVAVALVATAVTTAQAATIFSSALYNVTTPGGISPSTGANFQIGTGSSPVGSVAGITNTSSGGNLGYNFVFANSVAGGAGEAAAAALNASEANSIGAANGVGGVVKLDSSTIADTADTQDHGAFLALDGVYQTSAIDINLGTLAAGTYTVTFDWAGDQQVVNPPGGPLATTDSLTVGLTGATSVTHGPIAVPALGFNGWIVGVTDTFTTTGGSNSILSFLASGTPSAVQPAFVLLDNINVSTTTTPPPTIPEPSSLMLLSTGLIGLGGFIRSRFSKS